MRINLVFVGKTGVRDLDAAISRYVERLGHYCAVKVHYVKAEKVMPGLSDETIMSREAERISRLVGTSGHLALLDRSGREFDSPEFAKFLLKIMESGTADFWLAVGGPVGLSRELVGRAKSVISLSKMTFAHDLARLMLAEQLYRAFTILRGEPYHR